MARTEHAVRKGSLLGTVAKIGMAAGAVQVLRSNTVRSKISETVDKVKKRIREGADDAGDMVEPTPAMYKESSARHQESSEAYKHATSTASKSKVNNAPPATESEVDAATEKLKSATENIRHSET